MTGPPEAEAVRITWWRTYESRHILMSLRIESHQQVSQTSQMSQTTQTTRFLTCAPHVAL